MKCSNPDCGKKGIPHYANFCPDCGTIISVNVDTSNKKEVSSTQISKYEEFQILPSDPNIDDNPIIINKPKEFNGCSIIFILMFIGIIITVIVLNNDEISDDNIENSKTTIDEKTATYLSVSNDNLISDSEGGVYEININTDGNWEISTGTAFWGHISKEVGSLTLTIDKNATNSYRSDYFVVKAGNYEKRINIKQYANTNPSASIEKIWMEYNIYKNGYLGMNIHVKFNVYNMNGKTIYGYAYFYYSDNTTPLHDANGNNLKFYNYGISNYDQCIFNDLTIFVPYFGLNMGSGTGSVTLSFDISIVDASGNQFARIDNTQFIYTQ